MSTIGPIGSSLGTSHAQVLKRAQEALETQKPPSEGFGDRITNAIDQVAAAQSRTAGWSRPMKWAWRMTSAK